MSKVAMVLAATLALVAIAPAAGAENRSATNRATVVSPYKPASETLRQKQSGGERSIIIVSGKNSKSGSVGSPGSNVMLNPQPLPPKDKIGATANSNASKVMLNPQPLPPKDKIGASANSNASRVMLNPQPLPPKTR